MILLVLLMTLSSVETFKHLVMHFYILLKFHAKVTLSVLLDVLVIIGHPYLADTAHVPSK